MITLQITVSSTQGYKPMSTTILINNKKEYLLKRNDIHRKALFKICAQRNMTFGELARYGYTEVKARELVN